MRSHYPCPHCCSCHSAGPSTPRPPSKTPRWTRTAPALLLAALVTPAIAAPAPVTAPTRPDLGFLYPRLEKRVKDAGQAPDDASGGWFAPQNVEVEDLVRAGLSIKFVYDPSASTGRSPAAISEEEEEIREGSGAWVLDDFWELHGKRFGPHTTTADITDDSLPTPTPTTSSSPTPTASATSTSTTIPTLLAIESSLPTGWSDPDYRNSGIYRIPIVISFAVVIALMIGFLIGALVYRRAQRRKRRRKKDAAKEGNPNNDDDDDALTEPSLREKTARKSLSARVGRALRATSHNSQLRRRLTPHADADDVSPTDVEHAEAAPTDDTDLDRRIKSWARRSAAWRSHARAGMRRRMTKGQTPRRTPDVAADHDEPPNPNAVASHTTSRAASPIPSTSRTSRDELPPPIVVVTDTSNEIDRQEAAVNPASTPTVPTYSSVSGSGTGSNLSQPGSSTSTSANTSHDAHPDATPGDEPAYEYGSGLPPAYRRGGGGAVAMTEVRRGKMPMREWEGLDAGAFVAGQEDEEEGGGGEARVVMAHVATDDKAVLEGLRSMRGAPQVEPEMADVGEAPREEDVFDAPLQVDERALGLSRAFPPPPENQTRAIPREDESVIPEPPAKVVGTGPVARYGEVDLSLPGYLERGSGSSVLEAFAPGVLGPSVPPEELGPSVPPEGFGPSVPPEEFGLSAPPETFGPSAPPEEHSPSEPPEFSPSAPLAPSAPPLDAEEAEIPSAPPESDLLPHLETEMPRLRHLNSSSPLLQDNDPR